MATAQPATAKEISVAYNVTGRDAGNARIARVPDIFMQPKGTTVARDAGARVSRHMKTTLQKEPATLTVRSAVARDIRRVRDAGVRVRSIDSRIEVIDCRVVEVGFELIDPSFRWRFSHGKRRPNSI
jgi:hypothetical protein